MKLAHIINPVHVSQESDLFIAQPITFQCMKNAKQYASTFGIDVDLFHTCYDEDHTIVPEYFQSAGQLERSVMDVGNFKEYRKLPLIKDILDNLLSASDADYFIYTNVDIAPMPHFYTTVDRYISRGYDSLIINRRTISTTFTDIDDIPLMYAQIGQKHPGRDCFVFKRDAYLKFRLGDSCIGANWIGRVLMANLIATSQNFTFLKDAHLTFHLGDDRTWNQSKYQDFHTHNEATLKRLLSYLVSVEKTQDPMINELYSFHCMKL